MDSVQTHQSVNKTEHSTNRTPILGNAITCFGYETKTGAVRMSSFKKYLCSATSMESSRRDLSNDKAEHRSIWRCNQNTCHPVGSHPKQVWKTRKWGVLLIVKFHRLYQVVFCSYIFSLLFFFMWSTFDEIFKIVLTFFGQQVKSVVFRFASITLIVSCLKLVTAYSWAAFTS